MPIILATQEEEIGKIVVPSQPGQKVIETPSQQKELGMMANACHRSYMGGVNRKNAVQTGLGFNVRPYLKNN
jgi:hypothetical protein